MQNTSFWVFTAQHCLLLCFMYGIMLLRKNLGEEENN